MSSHDDVIQDMIFGLENLGYVLDDFADEGIEKVDVEYVRGEIKSLFQGIDVEELSYYLEELVQRS